MSLYSIMFSKELQQANSPQIPKGQSDCWFYVNKDSVEQGEEDTLWWPHQPLQGQDSVLDIY